MLSSEFEIVQIIAKKIASEKMSELSPCLESNK